MTLSGSTSVVRARPRRKRAGAAKHTPHALATSAISAGNAIRPLTLAEAAKVAETAPPLSTLSPNCKHTSLVDKSVLSKYEQVNKSTKVTGKGTLLFLRSILEQQRHLERHHTTIKQNCVSLGNGFRKGVFRVMTLKSFRESHVSVLKRIYKKQNPNRPAFSGQTLQDIDRIVTDAKTFLTPSREMLSIGVDETTLLISAIGQGKRTFFSEASLMSAILESSRRISCFRKRQFSHIVSITNITDDERKEDKSAFLLEVSFKRWCDKGEGDGETDHHLVVLRGSVFNNGFIDSVFYLNRRCEEEFGVGLYDPITGRTLLDHISANPDLAFILSEPLFDTNVDDTYLLYRRAQENTNITGHCMRPHGVRKFMYSKGVEALESGEIASPNLAALRSQMAHSPYSRSGRTFYLGEQYTQSLNFAALFHPNKEIRRLGLRVNSKSLKEKWGLTEPARVLWMPMAENFDVVEHMVTTNIGRLDAKRKFGDAIPKFFDRPSTFRVLRKLGQLCRRFARTHSPESKSQAKEDLERRGKDMIINTLSSGLTRDDMIKYIKEKVLIFW
jgi:hypothetical protein